jgi:hypothetical protein
MKKRAQQCCVSTKDLSRDRSLVGFFVVGRNFCHIADVGDVTDGARGVAGIFDHAIERGFGVFINSADGGHQTGIEKSFDAGAELLGGLFRGSDDIVDHGAAASLASGAIFRIERGERRPYALRSFCDG